MSCTRAALSAVQCPAAGTVSTNYQYASHTPACCLQWCWRRRGRCWRFATCWATSALSRWRRCSGGARAPEFAAGTAGCVELDLTDDSHDALTMCWMQTTSIF